MRHDEKKIKKKKIRWSKAGAALFQTIRFTLVHTFEREEYLRGKRGGGGGGIHARRAGANKSRSNCSCLKKRDVARSMASDKGPPVPLYFRTLNIVPGLTQFQMYVRYHLTFIDIYCRGRCVYTCRVNEIRLINWDCAVDFGDMCTPLFRTPR